MMKKNIKQNCLRDSCTHIHTSATTVLLVKNLIIITNACKLISQCQNITVLHCSSYQQTKD